MRELKVITDCYNTRISDAMWLQGDGRHLEVIEGEIEDYDLLLLTGGEDISPTLYGERRIHPRTFMSLWRDQESSRLYMNALRRQKPVIGICRGAQFLTAMAGGKLIQHVTGHTATKHKIHISHLEHFKIEANSTHHQMMYPFNMTIDSYNILGWTAPRKSTTYQDGRGKEIYIPGNFTEAEIVLYNRIKGLAIQGHPEKLSMSHEFSIACRQIAVNTVLKKLLKKH